MGRATRDGVACVRCAVVGVRVASVVLVSRLATLLLDSPVRLARDPKVPFLRLQVASLQTGLFLFLSSSRPSHIFEPKAFIFH